MAGIGDYIHYSQSNYIRYGTYRPGSKQSNYNEASSRFSRAKQNLKSRIMAQSGASSGQELEDILNAVYYPTNPDQVNDYTPQVHKIAQESISNRLNNWIITWSQGAGVVNSGQQSIGAKVKFSEKTIISIRNKLQNELKRLSHTNDLTKSTEAVKQNMVAAMQELDQILEIINNHPEIKNAANQVVYSEAKGLITKDMIRSINNKLQAISQFGRASAIGDSFEAGLAGFDDSVNHFVNGIYNKLIDEGIITGTKVSDLGGSISAERFSPLVTGNSNFSKVINTTVGDSLKLNGKQQTGATYKMDVNLTYQSENYRISAKNYQLKDDARVTLMAKVSPLRDMLLRTLDDDTINHYLNVVSTVDMGGQKINNNLLQQAHSLAHFSIAVEALTGSSQTTGYSNYLVINNRTAKQIRVLAMYSLLDRFNQYFTIQGYPDKFQPFNVYQGDANAEMAAQRIASLINKIHSIKVGATLKTQGLFG